MRHFRCSYLIIIIIMDLYSADTEVLEKSLKVNKVSKNEETRKVE